LESEKFQAVHGRVGNYETEEELHEIRLELHQLSNHLFGYPVDCSSHINPAPEGYSNLLTLVDNTATRWVWGDGDGLNVSVPFDRILELEKPQPTCGVVG
jgi:3',5'-cyclic AMP phosphodiesterase CpdA